MQKWIKLKAYNDIDFDDYSYSAVPLLVGIDEDKLIITKRNSEGLSIPIIYSFNKISFEIDLLTEKSILQLGKIGQFDEHGIMPVSSIIIEQKIYLYYIGWNKSLSVPFRNSIGLAISEDNGLTFYKPYSGPILDRSIHDPCFVASCCVLKDQNIYKMWYLSCDSWENVNTILTHKYNIKYAYSYDAINWIRNGRVCINYLHKDEYAISTPRVIIENNIYKMWYSYRGNNEIKTYRVGYAESKDGLNWERKDSEVGLTVSESGWDSEMICYPFIFTQKEKKYMLYNGNGYGKTGFGVAILEN